MNVYKVTFNVILIISLLVNSAGQSYALRPMAAACKSSPTGNKPEPLLHFPKWLRERLELEPELTQDLGKEAAQFVLKDCSFAFIGRISDIPRRLWKKLKPVKYFNNQAVVCENAISSMAKILKKAIPRYKSLSVKSVETELLQVALYYGELELKIKQRELSFDKLKEEILNVYGETRVRCPEFRAFLQGVSRQYGYNFRKDTKLLRKLIVHFITEVVLFGNLPKVILDSSGRSDTEEGISRDIVQACIKFIEETKLISGGEIKTLKELAKKGGASQREKKKMILSIFDFMPRKKVEEKIRRALKEDKQRKDKTSQHTIRRRQQATFVIEAQQKGVLAGLEIAMLVFKMVNPRLEVKPLLLDGDELRKGKPILIVRGNARSVMGAERVALNYLQQLSGIATMTAKFVKPTAGTNAKILDTRKTTPGMRAFQKYAVRVGGGKNHRMDLEEMDLIKDTHLDLIRQELGKDEGIITEAVKRARAEDKNIFIEVEVQSVKEAKEALENGVDRIMLDNMPCSEMKKVVKFVRRSEYYKLHSKPTIEASGNVNLRTVGSIAGTGVEYISVGLITRSAPSLDIHLKVKPVAEEVDINKLVSALTKAMRAARTAAGMPGLKIKSSSAGNNDADNLLNEIKSMEEKEKHLLTILPRKVRPALERIIATRKEISDLCLKLNRVPPEVYYTVAARQASWLRDSFPEKRNTAVRYLNECRLVAKRNQKQRLLSEYISLVSNKIIDTLGLIENLKQPLLVAEIWSRLLHREPTHREVGMLLNICRHARQQNSNAPFVNYVVKFVLSIYLDKIGVGNIRIEADEIDIPLAMKDFMSMCDVLPEVFKGFSDELKDLLARIPDQIRVSLVYKPDQPPAWVDEEDPASPLVVNTYCFFHAFGPAAGRPALYVGKAVVHEIFHKLVLNFGLFTNGEILQLARAIGVVGIIEGETLEGYTFVRIDDIKVDDLPRLRQLGYGHWVRREKDGSLLVRARQEKGFLEAIEPSLQQRYEIGVKVLPNGDPEYCYLTPFEYISEFAEAYYYANPNPGNYAKFVGRYGEAGRIVTKAVDRAKNTWAVTVNKEAKVSLAGKDTYWGSFWQPKEGDQGAFQGEYPKEVTGFLLNTIKAMLHADRTAKIIDIGSGADMWILKQIENALTGLDLYGLDVLDESDIRESATSNITYSQALANNTGFVERFFDVVVSTFTVDYLDRESVVKEIFRILGDNGMAIFVFHHPESNIIPVFRVAEITLNANKMSLLQIRKFIEDEDCQAINQRIEHIEANFKAALVPSREYKEEELKILYEALKIQQHSEIKDKLIERIIKDLAEIEKDLTPITHLLENLFMSAEEILEFFDSVGFKADVQILSNDKDVPIGYGVIAEKAGPGISHASRTTRQTARDTFTQAPKITAAIGAAA